MFDLSDDYLYDTVELKPRCVDCDKTIRERADFYTDKHGNDFCCLECALEYHEITER